MKFIPLTQGKQAIVDDEDYERVNQHKWCASRSYAIRNTKVAVRQYKHVSMHRVIMGNPDSDIDHINGNGLDNRKSNLRLCTPSQNMMNTKIRKDNTTGYRGVWFDKRRNTYTANLYLNSKLIWLGSFRTPEEAALAYNQGSIKYHGEFARINKIC